MNDCDDPLTLSRRDALGAVLVATAVTSDARTSLLDLLREQLGLTGSNKGCDHGRRVVSCLTLAAKLDGRKVMTIEGLADGERHHPMQQAFIDHDALQCGYCNSRLSRPALVLPSSTTASPRPEMIALAM